MFASTPESARSVHFGVTRVLHSHGCKRHVVLWRLVTGSLVWLLNSLECCCCSCFLSVVHGHFEHGTFCLNQGLSFTLSFALLSFEGRRRTVDLHRDWRCTFFDRRSGRCTGLKLNIDDYLSFSPVPPRSHRLGRPPTAVVMPSGTFSRAPPFSHRI